MWFAILESIVVASGLTRDRVEQILQEILPAEKREFVYVCYILAPDCQSGRTTADKRKIKDSLKFPLVTSFIRKTLYAITRWRCNMRRKDREITDLKEIEGILTNNIVCRIAFSDKNMPYIVPMNYGYQKNKIFLHSAKGGKKNKIIKDNNQVCFEITDSIEIIKSENACDFDTKYRSVIGFGEIKIVDDIERKKEALQIIMYQQTKNKEWNFSEEMISKINVLYIEIKSLTGKKSGF